MSTQQKTKRVTRIYTDDDRREAAKQFAIIGTYRGTERVTGIPNETLRGWQDTSEWQSTLASVRSAITQEHVVSFQRLVTEANKAAMDRLVNGDEVVVNKGKDGVEVVRKAVSARDAMIMSSIATEKSQLLQRLPTAINASDDRLERIAMRLVDTLASARGGRVIDAEVVSKLPAGG